MAPGILVNFTSVLGGALWRFRFIVLLGSVLLSLGGLLIFCYFRILRRGGETFIRSGGRGASEGRILWRVS